MTINQSITNSKEKFFMLTSSKSEEYPSNFRKFELGHLWVSASKQPSPIALCALQDKANKLGKVLHIIDLREESHFFIEGESITFCNGAYNNENMGLSLEQIQEKESLLQQLLIEQKTISVYEKTNQERLLSTHSLQTEQQWIESLPNTLYTRIPCTDHVASKVSNQADLLIALIANAQKQGNIWIHFHCRGGKQRSVLAMFTAFLFLHRNSEKTAHEILKSLLILHGFELEKAKYLKVKDTVDLIYKQCLQYPSSSKRIE